MKTATLVFAFICLIAAEVSAISVNGRNVNRVEFGLNGTPKGTAQQMGSNWVMEIFNGAKTTYKETHRDEWSVYLVNPSTKARLQMDLHTKKINVKEGGTAYRELYQVRSSFNLTGRNVSLVQFSGGYLKETRSGDWVEMNSTGQRQFTFKRTGRDDWSVYLHDASRNVYLQVDMHTKKINYKEGNGQYSVLYQINQGFSVTGYNCKAVYFKHDNKEHSFVRTEKGKWAEMTGNTERFHFTETGRDAWSVYLHDASRNVYIQLDMHTRKINYKEGNEPYRHQYTMFAAQPFKF